MHKFLESFDGVKIHYRINRGKNMLVFLHGVISNYTAWKLIYEEMENLGYGTLTIDLRGHGKSEDKNVNVENIIKDLELILKEEELKDYVLIGNSLGANIALKFLENLKLRAQSILFNPLSQDTKKSMFLYFFANFVKLISFIIPGKNVFEDLSDEHNKNFITHYLGGFDFRKRSLKNYSNLVLELYHSTYDSTNINNSLLVYCRKDQGLISESKFIYKNKGKDIKILDEEHIILSRKPYMVLDIIKENVKHSNYNKE